MKNKICLVKEKFYMGSVYIKEFILFVNII